MSETVEGKNTAQSSLSDSTKIADIENELNEKISHAHGTALLRATKASGTLMAYFVDLMKISMLVVPIVLVVLLVPVNDPDLGFARNLSYYLLYNPYVSILYCLGSYSRLSHICRRGKIVAEKTGKPEFENLWGMNWRSLICVTVAVLTQGGGMALIGFLQGGNAAHGYQLLYACPITCTVVDVLFIFLLPESERHGQNAGFLAEYSKTCGLPIFTIFLPIAIKAFLPSLCSQLIPVFIFPLLSRAVQRFTERSFTKEANKVGFECCWMESGIPVHLEGMICIAEMMLFPGAESALVLAGIVGCELTQRMSDLYWLRDAMQVNKYSSLPLDSSKLVQPQTSPREPFSPRDSSPTLSRSASRMSIISATEGSKEQAKRKALELNHTAWDKKLDLCIVHMTTLSCPVIFAVLTYFITQYRNVQYYYVYECLQPGQELLAVQFAGIAFGFQMLYYSVDISFLAYHGTADEFFMLCQSYLQSNWMMLFFTFAFTCAVFTSCFVIKHDGIAILENIMSPCGDT